MSSPHASAAAVAGKPASQPSAPAALAAIRSEQLLQGRKQVEIIHNGAVYRLQATRQGKLILTK
ncbi:hemin uptake protein HemP [Ottowia cancrivicina]|uniref:Hemin uptake protein HemP n=1 Tax=Ottowia cancrivicina TaxID=3040346 RepID=A0AAW6REW5_9BURK|nr:hemin uptake protein HemP [Ottowia sp. 10c7w1]MDG9698953.1 hemin uptake protein HemP [Ottowia sp. 10c7w1]